MLAGVVVIPVQQGKRASQLKCYNCGGIGHHACQCPSNALFYCGQGWQRRQGLTPHGVVEGQVAKILPEQVPIRCAHGDTVMYPLANIKVQLGGMAFMVEAAVSEHLPMSILLGMDVPQLVELLNGVGREPGLNSNGGEAMDVLIMMRSQ